MTRPRSEKTAPKRAEWRRLLGDPTTVLGWTPRVLCETPSLLLLLAIGLGIAAGALRLPILVGGTVATLVMARFLPYRSPRPSPGLPTLPLPKASFPVGVTLLHWDVPIGADDAIASFVDGWLHVEGRRTSFALRATDGRARLGLASPTLRIDLEGGAFTVLIEPALFASASRHGVPEFAAPARAWIAARAVPLGEPVLPPRAVLLESYARLVVRGVLQVAVCAAASFGLWPAPLVTATVLPMLGFWSLALFTPALTVGRWRSLRRLDAGTPLAFERERSPESSGEAA